MQNKGANRNWQKWTYNMKLKRQRSVRKGSKSEDRSSPNRKAGYWTYLLGKKGQARRITLQSLARCGKALQNNAATCWLSSLARISYLGGGRTGARRMLSFKAHNRKTANLSKSKGMQCLKQSRRMSNFPCSSRGFCKPLTRTLYQEIDRQVEIFTITMTAVAPRNFPWNSSMSPPNLTRNLAQHIFMAIKIHNPSQITWAALFTRQESLGANLTPRLLITSLTPLLVKKIRRTRNPQEFKSYKRTIKNLLPLNLQLWGLKALSTRKMTSQMMIGTGASENRNLWCKDPGHHCFRT